mgnify:FL=1
MTVSSLATAGWICDPIQTTPPDVVVGGILVGQLTSATLTGTLSDPGTLVGVLPAAGVLSGALSASTLTGALSAVAVLQGILRCEGVAVANISITQGDTLKRGIEINDSGGSDEDITEGIFRLAAKRSLTETNSEAFYLTTSYTGGDIEITTPLSGLASWTARSHKVSTWPLGENCYDIEYTKKDGAATPAPGGTLSFVAGSTTVTLVGGTIANLKEGMVIEPGGGAPNDERVRITSVDEDNDQFETDFSGWSTASGISFSAFEGETTTVISGTLTVSADVVD